MSLLQNGSLLKFNGLIYKKILIENKSYRFIKLDNLYLCCDFLEGFESLDQIKYNGITYYKGTTLTSIQNQLTGFRIPSADDIRYIISKLPELYNRNFKDVTSQGNCIRDDRYWRNQTGLNLFELNICATGLYYDGIHDGNVSFDCWTYPQSSAYMENIFSLYYTSDNFYLYSFPSSKYNRVDVNYLPIRLVKDAT